MMETKEKLRLFNNLKNHKFAKIDMNMLVRRNPTHSGIMRFGRNPTHYADDILYSLLDVCTPDEIISNRAEESPKDTPDEKEPETLSAEGSPKDTPDKKEPETLSAEGSPKDTSDEKEPETLSAEESKKK